MMTIKRTQLIALITALISVVAIIYQLPKDITVELTSAIVGLITVLFTLYEQLKPKKKKKK